MSGAKYPSGPWTGFYNYTRSKHRFTMDLILNFRGGAIEGDGSDDVGLFRIAGRYDSQAGECSWTKTYVGAHSVQYIGYCEEKGIWGTWVLDPVTKGGFHIWPLGDAPDDLLEKMARESKLPKTTSEPSPKQPAPRTPPKVPAGPSCHGITDCWE